MQMSKYIVDINLQDIERYLDADAKCRCRHHLLGREEGQLVGAEGPVQ
jgi:hypothetical protein